MSTASPPSAPASAPRLLALSAAWLLLFGLLTGGYVAAAMTGKLPVNPRMALAAHLNALMGTFLLLGVGWSFQFLHYGPSGQRRLAWAFIVPLFAGWFVTAVKAALDVPALDYTGAAVNDAVFLVLVVGVVLPSLGAAGAWVYGLRQGGLG